LRERHDRVGDRGAERADQDRDMLFVDQSFGRADPDLRIAFIVGVDGLDRAVEHAAGEIDALQSELDRISFALAPIGRPAAERGRDADANRIGRPTSPRCQQARGEAKRHQEKCRAPHCRRAAPI
jgi:hypothetical protein